MKVNLDIGSLTLREIEDFETKTQMGISDLGAGKAMPAKALRALVWILTRRNDPSYSYEDAGDVKITELDFEGGAEPDPT